MIDTLNIGERSCINKIKKIYVFHLSEWNDVDHIAPVIWKFLSLGLRVRCLAASDFDFRNDYRIQYLGSFNEFGIETPTLRDKVRYRILYGRVGRKILRIIGKQLYAYLALKIWPSRIIGKRNVESMIGVFEWGGQGHLNYYDFVLEGGLVCALPHGGPFTYLNDDFTKGIRETGPPDFSSRNEFTSIVFASHHHANWATRHGFDPRKIAVLGSTRFCPEWQKINLDILPRFIPKKKDSEKLKVVFFVPHWTYNVFSEEVYRALLYLASDPDIYLVVKGHTRGSGDIKKDFSILYPDVESNSHEPSPSLVRWADVVVNVSSSIAFEAIMQCKPVIHAHWCHDNSTIFDDGLNANVATDMNRFIYLVEQAKNGELKPLMNLKSLSEHLGWTYGEDVLMRYVNHLSKL